MGSFTPRPSLSLPVREHPRVLERPPAELDASDDVLLRHLSPRAAVGTVVAMVAHHEVVALADDDRTPRVVHLVLVGDEVVGQRDVVAVDASVDAANRV